MATSGSKSVTVTSWDTLKFSWSRSSYSIANNTSTIKWTLQLISTSDGRIDSSVAKDWSVTVNGVKYSGTNYIAISNNATKTLASGTTTITHNTDGSKTFSYSFSQEFAITFAGSYIGTKSGSGSGTLDTIPRKSSLSASNGTLDKAQTLTVTRQASSFTHTITYKCGSASGTIVTKSSDTSISFTPPLDLAKQNTTGSSVSITFTITTYTGDTSIGSNTKTITCTIPSAKVKPSCTIALSDPTGYLSTYGAYVKGLSKFKVVVTPTLAYNSPIASYSVKANGVTYNKASFTTGVLSSSGTLNVTATVTDKRGNTSNTATISATVLNYALPAISKMTAIRCNQDGTPNNRGAYIKVTFNSKVYPLNDKNSATYKLEYKKSSDTNYTEKPLDTLTNSYELSEAFCIFEADINSSYNVIVTVTDNIDESTATADISTGFTTIHYKKGGRGVGIGKVAELDDVLDIGFKTRFFGGIMPLVLPDGANLNDYKTPNFYTSGNSTAVSSYENCPVPSHTFDLEVMETGVEGQVKQRLTTCSKTASRVFERFFYQNAWGEWICTSDFGNTLLWDGSTTSSGGYYMTAGHTVNLSEPISKQATGIVLVFSFFNEGSAQNNSFNFVFIPKLFQDKHNGAGISCVLTGVVPFSAVASKYLYIYDTYIKGNDYNNTTGAASGITYANNKYVLRYVIGV